MAGYLSTDPYGGTSLPSGLPLSSPTTNLSTPSASPFLASTLTQSSVRPAGMGTGTTGGAWPQGLTLAALGTAGTGTPGTSASGAGMGAAQIGEVRMINGQLATWDGRGWKVS